MRAGNMTHRFDSERAAQVCEHEKENERDMQDAADPVARRSIVAALVGLAGAAQLGSPAQAAPVDAGVGEVGFGTRSLRFADLTHALTRQFNFGPDPRRIAFESVDGSGAAVGMLMHRVSLIEHTGTHIDAPSHFSADQPSLGEIALRDLIVPLAVVDISARVADEPNAELLPEDVLAWESRHGPLPAGCCVALHSGVDPLEQAERVRAGGRLSAAGFSVAAARMLIDSRDVRGIAVDAMTIDAGGNVPEYPVHRMWLRSGRWGIEGITNLQAVPPAGALLVAAAAPVVTATGFPVRALALF